MSFLRDFGGAFFSNVGNQMQQREDEDRQRQQRMDDAQAMENIRAIIERRRTAEAYNRQAKLQARQPEAFGAPYQGDDGRWYQGMQTKVSGRLDPETADVLEPERYEQADPQQIRDPRKIGERRRYEGDRINTYETFDGEISGPPVATAPRYKPGGSGDAPDGSKPPPSRVEYTDTHRITKDWNPKTGKWEETSRARRNAQDDEADVPSRETAIKAGERLARASKLIEEARTVEEALGVAASYGQEIASGEGLMYGGKPLDLSTAKRLARDRLKEFFSGGAKEPPAPADKASGNPDAPPATPAGAKEGQVYEDDTTGKRWKVSGGRMVPA